MKALPPLVRRVDARAPLRAPYEAVTAFEAHPRILEERQGGALAGIVLVGEETRDERLAWTSLEGPSHRGSVTFRSLDASAPRIPVEFTCDPLGLPADPGPPPGGVGARVQRVLEQFRKFVEQQSA